jgi:hypothetical protein
VTALPPDAIRAAPVTFSRRLSTEFGISDTRDLMIPASMGTEVWHMLGKMVGT